MTPAQSTSARMARAQKEAGQFVYVVDWVVLQHVSIKKPDALRSWPGVAVQDQLKACIQVINQTF
jgi:hypothetical protein